LEIVSDKLIIPLKFCNLIETEPKLKLKQGKLDKETGTIEEIKTVRVIMKDKKTIKEIVSWSGNDTFIEKNGKLTEVDDEIKNLIKQDQDKRTDRRIEFLGIHSKNKLDWKHFNGLQFVAEVGTKIKNQILSKENAIYSCLYSILKDKFMLICFFTRSGQELGALSSDIETGKLTVSGLHSSKVLKQFSKTELKSRVSETSIDGIEKLLTKMSNCELEYKLDWKDYYRTCIENIGIDDKRFNKQVNKRSKDIGDQELSFLLETLIV
jgi:hypothetical protein